MQQLHTSNEYDNIFIFHRVCQNNFTLDVKHEGEF